jgi:hypothetical protein
MSLAAWKPVIQVGGNRFPCEPNALAETLSLSGQPAKLRGQNGLHSPPDFTRALYPSEPAGKFPSVLRPKQKNP